MDPLASLWAEFQRDPTTILLVCAITAFSYSAQALTGFGGAVLGMPILSAFKRLPVASAVPGFSLLAGGGGPYNLLEFLGHGEKTHDDDLSFAMIGGIGGGILAL